MSKDKKDIGIVGMWLNSNYGGALTYYGLYEAVKELGYSVLMLAQPLNSKMAPSYRECRFRELPYQRHECARIPANEEECILYNNMCHIFLAGSDQMFNPNIYINTKKIQSLFWARSNKGKIGYALSWGKEYFAGTDELKEEQRFFLSRFHKISVREKSAVKLVSDAFGLSADYVLDPVFLCDKIKFSKMAERGESRIPREKYLFAYLMTPTMEIIDDLIQFAKQKQIDCIRIITDAIPNKSVAVEEKVERIIDASVEEWIAYIKNAEYVITDSFHGTCFAILFERPFMVITNYNEYRDRSRLDSILNQLSLSNRIVETSRELLSENLPSEPDWGQIDKVIEAERSRCIMWLNNAISETFHKSNETWDVYDVLLQRNMESLAKIEKLEEKIRNQERDIMRKDRLNLCGKSMYTQKDIENFNEMRMTNNFDFLSKWLFIKQMGYSVSEELVERGYHKIAVYGVGRTGILFLNEIEQTENIQVAYMIDQNIEYYRERRVCKQVLDEDIDAIIVTPINAYDEIYKVLISSTYCVEVISLERIVSELYDRICD